MPLEPKELDALEDMLRFGGDAIEYARGLDFATFVADHKTNRATMYAIATVAEASHRVSRETQARWPHIPWPMIWAMRNILMHEYGRVDLPTVYQVATIHLPALLGEVRVMLDQESGTSSTGDDHG